jgi:serine/threonine protein kinase
VKGIIHGDLKPENVLVYKDGLGLFTARLTDFGYSTHLAGHHENIMMPKSWPWNAPEHHHRGFKPQQAKTMDMFSFGVLSLWIMYKSYLSGKIPFPPNMSWTSKYMANEAESVDRHTIERLKKDDKLTKLSVELLAADTALEEMAKLQLEGIFRIMLLCNPVAREAGLYSQG